MRVRETLAHPRLLKPMMRVNGQRERRPAVVKIAEAIHLKILDVCGICEPDSDEETRDPRGEDDGDFESDDSEDEEECRGKSDEELKKESVSLRHLLTHLPKNKF